MTSFTPSVASVSTTASRTALASALTDPRVVALAAAHGVDLFDSSEVNDLLTVAALKLSTGVPSKALLADFANFLPAAVGLELQKVTCSYPSGTPSATQRALKSYAEIAAMN